MTAPTIGSCVLAAALLACAGCGEQAEPAPARQDAPAAAPEAGARPPFVRLDAVLATGPSTVDAGAPRDACATCPKALLITAAPPPLGDEVLKTRLELMGYQVVSQDHDSIVVEAAQEAKVVVISESVSSTKVAAKFKDVAVPVINMEPSILDDMGMTGPMNGVDYGAESSQQSLKIHDGKSPLAGGFSGVLPVSVLHASFLWGVPGAGAEKIATLERDGARWVIFAYERGAPMVIGTAAARRLAFYLTADAARWLPKEGAALLEAAVSWAVAAGAPPAPPMDAAPPDVAAADAAADTRDAGAADTRDAPRADTRDAPATDGRRR